MVPLWTPVCCAPGAPRRVPAGRRASPPPCCEHTPHPPRPAEYLPSPGSHPPCSPHTHTGLTHFATNYTVFQFAPAAGSYLLATRLTGALYDRAAAAHGDGHTCVGPDCFRTAFLILAAGCAAGAAASGVATARSAGVYRQIARHLNEVEAAEEAQDP